MGELHVSDFILIHTSKPVVHQNIDTFRFALRGPSSDWDRIAKITGDDGWSWENVLPFAKKVPPFSFSLQVG